MTAQFETFISKEKFIEDSIMYTGVDDEELKDMLTERVNLAAKDFKAIAESGNATDQAYLSAIKTGLHRFQDIYLEIETEDRERLCGYFEELMDIVGLESSEGQLNVFMYGFDPNTL